MYCEKLTGAVSTFCPDHLRTMHGLEIKQSNRPECGLGLFATRRFSFDELVARTEGEAMMPAAFYKRYGHNDVNLAPYAMNAGTMFIDELVARSPCSYSNDPVDFPKMQRLVRAGLSAETAYIRASNYKINNAIMCMNCGARPAIYAARAIEPGEEICWSYGPGYWSASN
jgi:hypothetical protein